MAWRSTETQQVQRIRWNVAHRRMLGGLTFGFGLIVLVGAVYVSLLSVRVVESLGGWGDVGEWFRIGFGIGVSVGFMLKGALLGAASLLGLGLSLLLTRDFRQTLLLKYHDQLETILQQCDAGADLDQIREGVQSTLGLSQWSDDGAGDAVDRA